MCQTIAEVSTKPEKTEDVIPKFLRDHLAREWVCGFLLVGVFVGAIGSLLVAWRYHVDINSEFAGLHFLVLNIGYLLGTTVAYRLLRHRSIRLLSLVACATGCVSLLSLSFFAPPMAAEWRLLALGFVGVAGGMLMTALIYVLESAHQESPAATINLAGVLFGLGCLLATLIVGIAYVGNMFRWQTAFLAAIPLLFFVIYFRNRYPPALEPVRQKEEELVRRKSIQDLRSVAAVLLGLLLFFQFGVEWSIAGWLPVFLIRRLGVNPASAIFTLALYFLALMLGRMVAQMLLPKVRHWKLLLTSTLVALIGYLLLSFTPTLFGASAAVIVIGAGFAPIYPLVAEKLDDRFAYHPGFYNGIFSVAITGGMSAPWVLGYVDAYWGMRYAMLLPTFGSIAVLVLLLLITFEAHLMGGPKKN